MTKFDGYSDAARYDESCTMLLELLEANRWDR